MFGNLSLLRIFQVVRWLGNSKRPTLPLTFLLGFYVSLVVKRWWNQYIQLPFPDEEAMLLKAGLTKEVGEEGDNQRIRRTTIRYLMLAYILCLRRISSRIRGQCPDMNTLVGSGLLRADEASLIGEEDQRRIGCHGGSNWWLPIKWSISIVRQAQMDGRFENAPTYTNAIKGIMDFKKSLSNVISYGHVSVPLVYSQVWKLSSLLCKFWSLQVVHLAVYFYFLVALVGRQATFEEGNKENEKTYQAFTPIFLIMEFLFYFGWLNVASTLYNPFGDDDDDFELTGLMDRHIRVCMSIVEDDKDVIPKVQDDPFWQSPENASDGWYPTVLVKQAKINRFSLERFVSYASGGESGVQESDMQTERRDMGMMGSMKRWRRPSTNGLQNHAYEEEPRLQEVPEVIVEKAP